MPLLPFPDSNNSGDNLYTMINTGPGNRNNVTSFTLICVDVYILKLCRSSAFCIRARPPYLLTHKQTGYLQYAQHITNLPNTRDFFKQVGGFHQSHGSVIHSGELPWLYKINAWQTDLSLLTFLCQLTAVFTPTGPNIQDAGQINDILVWHGNCSNPKCAPSLLIIIGQPFVMQKNGASAIINLKRWLFETAAYILNNAQTLSWCWNYPILSCRK